MRAGRRGGGASGAAPARTACGRAARGGANRYGAVSRDYPVGAERRGHRTRRGVHGARLRIPDRLVILGLRLCASAPLGPPSDRDRRGREVGEEKAGEGTAARLEEIVGAQRGSMETQ